MYSSLAIMCLSGSRDVISHDKLLNVRTFRSVRAVPSMAV